VPVLLTKEWTSIKFKHAQPLLCHARVIKDFYLRVLSRLSVKNRIARPLVYGGDEIYAGLHRRSFIRSFDSQLEFSAYNLSHRIYAPLQRK